MGRTLYNIGLCKNSQSQYEDAVTYFKRAIAVFEESNILPSLPQAYFLITQIHYKLGKMDKAHAYHSKGMAYSQKAGDSIYLSEFEFLKSLYLSGLMKKQFKGSLISSKVKCCMLILKISLLMWQNIIMNVKIFKKLLLIS